jgi:hypothetical protein
MTRKHSTTGRAGQLEQRYLCPRCEAWMVELSAVYGATAYVCGNVACATWVPALSIDDTVVRPIICPGYTCRRCEQAVTAVLLSSQQVICTCPRCRYRNWQYEARLAELEAHKRDQAQRLQREMAHIPFARMTPQLRASCRNPERAAQAMIESNRTQRHAHEQLAKVARDLEGHYYCVRHQVQMRRCDWGFYCPIRRCSCTYRPQSWR